MYAIFDTLEDYESKNSEINTYLGYPNNSGTARYASELPLKDIDGKYVMHILNGLEHLFGGCRIVEIAEYRQGTNNETY